MNDITKQKYINQIAIKEFGLEFQNKLQDISVLIIGLGGIGCAVLNHLCCTGFKNIGIIDFDKVSLSNLHRQYIYTEYDIGKFKTEVAKNYCRNRNSDINISEYRISISNNNALNLIEQYEYILDCTDNQLTRYVINDACVILDKFYIFGSSIQTSGQVTKFNYNNGCCYRCINEFKDDINSNNTCSVQGVLGPIPNLIGNLMVIELIKEIKLSIETKCNESNECNKSNKLLIYDFVHGFQSINAPPKNKKCLVCGDNKIINKSNFRLLDIYNSNCKIDKISKYSKSSVEHLIKDFISINILETDDLDEKFNELEQLNINKNYIITCDKNIKSSILVEKLRANNKNNFWTL